MKDRSLKEDVFIPNNIWKRSVRQKASPYFIRRVSRADRFLRKGCLQEFVYTPSARRILAIASNLATDLEIPLVPEVLFLGIILEGENRAVNVIKMLGVDPQKLRTQLIWRLAGSPTGEPYSLPPRIALCGTDLTRKAEEGQLDPMVGREKQLERVVQILGRRTKK
jgi:ATP-dependent Clp protease ATP-binding subunit ClpC